MNIASLFRLRRGGLAACIRSCAAVMEADHVWSVEEFSKQVGLLRSRTHLGDQCHFARVAAVQAESPLGVLFGLAVRTPGILYNQGHRTYLRSEYPEGRILGYLLPTGTGCPEEREASLEILRRRDATRGSLQEHGPIQSHSTGCQCAWFRFGSAQNSTKF